MKGYVYMLVDPHGRKYIGRTIDFKRRMHRYEHPRDTDDSSIYRSIKEYGFENFKKEILETVDGERQAVVDEINRLEAEYIAKYNTVEDGYNIRSQDSRSGEPMKMSLETREKMRLSHLGKKHSEESRAKRAGANAYQGRKVRSDTLGMEFDTLVQAAHYVGVRSGCKISECIAGKRKRTGTDPKTGEKISDWKFV